MKGVNLHAELVQLLPRVFFFFSTISHVLQLFRRILQHLHLGHLHLSDFSFLSELFP